MTSIVFDIPCPEEMATLGHRLGELLFPGAVVALIGQLGAGKTFLTRAIAEGLAIPDSRIVSSPTFVLIQEYPARIPIYHFDAYRLTSEAAFLDLGATEYFEGDGVCLVEWADRVPASLPPARLEVTIIITGENSRTVKIISFGPRYELLLSGLKRLGLHSNGGWYESNK